MRVKCLYCDVENDALETSGFCDNCGKKLPDCAMIRTRKEMILRSGGDEIAAPAARSRVADALFATAVVQLACGGLFLVLGPALLTPVPTTFLTTAVAWTVFPTLAFALLGLWARSQPRPAVLLALTLYAVWVAIGFLAQPQVAAAWLLVHAVMAGLLGWVAWLGFRS
ncbi:MAG: hypothetical protein U0797_02290 [Gemmataceae bacterium]